MGARLTPGIWPTACAFRAIYSGLQYGQEGCNRRRVRIAVDRHRRRWFRHHVELSGWTVLPIDLESVEEAYSLPEPFHRDPADRLIVAETHRRQASVVTADQRILDYPHVRAVWGA